MHTENKNNSAIQAITNTEAFKHFIISNQFLQSLNFQTEFQITGKKNISVTDNFFGPNCLGSVPQIYCA